MGNDPLRGVDDFFDGVTEFMQGDYATKAPAIGSGPPTYRPPEKWYPPSRDLDDGSFSYYTVHTDVLHTIADTIQGEVPDLRHEIGKLRAFASGGALTRATHRWETGDEFGARMQSVAEGFASAAEQIADIHIASVRKLAATASAYADAEYKSHQRVLALQAKGEGAASLQVMPKTTHPETDSVPLTAREIVIKRGSLPLMSLSSISLMGDGIMKCLHDVEPAAYGDFAACLRALGATLGQAAGRIVTSVRQMASGSNGWNGSSAAKAFEAFQVLHTQTATLAAQATQTGNVMRWLGDEVLPQYKAIPDPRISPHFQTARGQAQAHQSEVRYLQALDNHLHEAYDAIPSPLAGTPSGSPGAAAPGSHVSQKPVHTPARNPFGAYLQ